MILSCIYAVNTRFNNGGLGLSNDDCYISYLPAAHLFEQVMFSAACQYGMKAGYFSGDVTKLVEDCGVLKPTVFPSVPRLYNKIYGKIQEKLKAATGCKAMLINNAQGAKVAAL